MKATAILFRRVRKRKDDVYKSLCVLVRVWIYICVRARACVTVSPVLTDRGAWQICFLVWMSSLLLLPTPADTPSHCRTVSEREKEEGVYEV